MPTPETINTAFLIATFILLILTLRDRLYGLLAYTCISFTRPGLYYSFLGRIRFELIVAIIMLIIIILSKESRDRLSLSRNAISRNLFIFFIVVVLSMIQAFDFQTALDRTWYFTKIYAFYLIIIAFVMTEKDLKIFLWTFVILLAYVGYEPLYNYLQGIVVTRQIDAIVTYGQAAAGRGTSHNTVGLYMLQALCFLWYLTVSSKNVREKLMGASLVIFCLVGIMLSGSRAALVGLIIGILSISYFSEHRKAYLLAGSLVIVVALMSMSSDYRTYMSSILEFGRSDPSAHNRILGLRHGLEMLVKRPILGVGPGCYPVARGAWFDHCIWSHNIYGQLPGDLGLVGVLVWGIFVYSYLKSCFLIRRELSYHSWYSFIATAVIVSNIIILALGFFSHNLYEHYWYVSAAIVVVTQDLLRNRQTEGLT